MSSAKKIFSNLGQGLNNLFRGSSWENGNKVPSSAADQNEFNSLPMPYCNQVQENLDIVVQNEHLPESEINEIQTEPCMEKTLQEHKQIMNTTNESQHTLTPFVVRNANEVPTHRPVISAPSVIRENSRSNSENPDAFVTVNRDIFSEHKFQNDNFSTPFSHDNFGPGQKLSFDNSPYNRRGNDQSQYTDTAVGYGTIFNTNKRVVHENEAKWQNDVLAMTSNNVADVITQECEWGSQRGNGLTYADSQEDWQMLDSNRSSRKDSRGEINASLRNEQRAYRRDVFENEKNLAGARRQSNEPYYRGSIGKSIENYRSPIYEQKYEFSDSSRQHHNATHNRNNFGRPSFYDKPVPFSGANQRQDSSQIHF